MNRRTAFLSVLLALALGMLYLRTASAYVEVPYTLGRLVAESTHIMVLKVEKVDKDGTITYVDRAINGIARRKMNLFFPDRVRDPRTKKVLNSHVRPRRKWDGKGGKHLSGQLFAGFATIVN